MDNNLTIRAVFNNQEASIIIGKQGVMITKIRQECGVNANVTRDIEGVQDRVATVSGPVTNVVNAYIQMLFAIFGSAPVISGCLKLLISHQVMGTVIGRKGTNIHHIQDTSGAHVMCSKSTMPDSTERLVQLNGPLNAIKIALTEIATCVLRERERAYYGAVFYKPETILTMKTNPTTTTITRFSVDKTEHVERVAVPADEAGSIIGRGGHRVSEIRKVTGCSITVPHDSNEQNERIFTIRGPQHATEKALLLLFGHLQRVPPAPAPQPKQQPPPPPPPPAMITYDLIDLSD